jgi:DNA-binding LacI/PurR family transcriptional regulator
MSKTRNRASHKHDLVKRFINDRIQRGVYNGKIPGVSKLAAEFEVNPLTVSRALDSLAAEGLVEKRSRVGTFVIQKKRVAVLSLQEKEKTTPAHNFYVPPIFHTMLASLEQAAKDNNLSVLPYATDVKDIDFINFIKGEVDGVVLLLSPNFDERELAIFDGIPWVKVMGKDFISSRGNVVTYDNSVIGPIAAEYLMKQDCKKYYYFGGCSRDLFCERYKSFDKSLKSAGFVGGLIELDITQLFVEEMLEKAEVIFKEIFTPDAPKTGLFLSADIYGVPIYQLLYSMGMKPVVDVPIVSCNNNKLVLYGLYPKPAVIDIRLADIGSRAIGVLMDCFEAQKNDAGEKIILMPELLIN